MNKKFTLIELLLVIAVIGILAAIIIPNTKDVKEQAFVSKVNGNIRNMQTAVDLYAYENGGKYPSNIQPTLEVPEPINFDMLYPKYLKATPKEVDLLKEKYWVDFMGKVWGSTVDAPTDVFVSDKYFEWGNEKKITGYKIYKIRDSAVLGTVKNNMLSYFMDVVPLDRIDKYKIENLGGHYLISAIDEYGLETAPVGSDYLGYLDDWFKPILSKEGEFYFQLNSKDVMYWDAFVTREDKPEGTSINYEFAVKDSNGEFMPFEEDFYSLPPSKGLNIKVIMKGHDGKLPSLYDMRVYFHFADEDAFYKQPSKVEKNPENKNEYTYELEDDEYVFDITIPKVNSREEGKDEPKIEYSEDGGETFKPVESPTDIPPGSIIKITEEKPEDEKEEQQATKPIVTVDKKQPVVENPILPSQPPSNGGSEGDGSGGNGENPPTPTTPPNPSTPPKRPNDGTIPPKDSEIEDEEWVTIEELGFFAYSGDGQIVDWTSADIVDKQPDHTRILYRYSTSNGSGWSGYVDDISKASNSRTIKVTAILQIEKGYETTAEHPEVVSVVVNFDNGSHRVNTNTPTGYIVVNKDNNEGRETISTSSNLTWSYQAFDPKGKQIIEAIWGGDKRDNYDTPGTYTVTLQFKNSDNVLSEMIRYTFEVKNEKPVAVMGPDSNSTFSNARPIKFTYINSFDPDGDSITKAEWGGDYRTTAYPVGSYVVKLRVQDSEGNWSDWVEKTYRVYDTIFDGLPPEALDGDDTTGGKLVGFTNVVDLSNDNLENRTITYRIGSSNTETNVYFLDEDGNKTYYTFYNVYSGSYSTSTQIERKHPTGTSPITVYVKIPDNAKYMCFDVSDPTVGNSILYDFKLMGEPKQTPDVTYTLKNTQVTLDFTSIRNTGPYTFVTVVTKTTLANGNVSYTTKAIQTTSYSEYLNSGETKEFLLIPVWSGVYAEPIVVTATVPSRPSGIQWLQEKTYPALFDNQLDTHYSTTSNTELTWNGNLGGQTINMKIGKNGYYWPIITVLDSNNNPLTFKQFTNNTATVDVNSITFGDSTTSLTTRDFLIKLPENAAKIKIEAKKGAAGNTGGVYLYEISEKVSNESISISKDDIIVTATTSKIGFEYNKSNPNVTNLILIENNKFISNWPTPSTSATPNQTRTFILYPVLNNGYIGEPIQMTVTTPSS